MSFLPLPQSLLRRRRRLAPAAFTLTEMMIAVAISAIGMSIAYPFLVSEMNLYARNFSINKSNNSLRYSMQTLKRDIDMAIEPPVLATYSGSGSTATLTPMNSAAVSAQAILVYVNFGPAYNMPSTNQDNSPITNPASGINLVGHYTTGTGDQSAPLPSVGDRLLIMSPAPSSAAMLETITTNGVTYTKPGRRITKVSLTSSNSAGVKFTVWVDQTNTPLPSAPYPPGDQSVYLFHETAYMAYTVNNSAGTAVERQLRYVQNTANLATPTILIHDLDPTPQEIDTNTNATVQPFNFYGGRGNFSTLAVNLPIRAVDYAHAVADRNIATGTINVSSEFNTFIRSNPNMSMKYRMD